MSYLRQGACSTCLHGVNAVGNVKSGSMRALPMDNHVPTVVSRGANSIPRNSGEFSTLGSAATANKGSSTVRHSGEFCISGNGHSSSSTGSSPTHFGELNSSRNGVTKASTVSGNAHAETSPVGRNGNAKSSTSPNTSMGTNSHSHAGLNHEATVHEAIVNGGRLTAVNPPRASTTSNISNLENLHKGNWNGAVPNGSSTSNVKGNVGNIQNSTNVSHGQVCANGNILISGSLNNGLGSNMVPDGLGMHAGYPDHYGYYKPLRAPPVGSRAEMITELRQGRAELVTEMRQLRASMDNLAFRISQCLKFQMDGQVDHEQHAYVREQQTSVEANAYAQPHCPYGQQHGSSEQHGEDLVGSHVGMGPQQELQFKKEDHGQHVDLDDHDPMRETLQPTDLQFGCLDITKNAGFMNMQHLGADAVHAMVTSASYAAVLQSMVMPEKLMEEPANTTMLIMLPPALDYDFMGGDPMHGIDTTYPFDPGG